MKIFLLLILLCAVNVHSQTVSEGIVIPNTSEYFLKSEINHVKYRISISLPYQYNDSVNARFPVLYFLDGNVWLPLASSVLQSINKTDVVEPIIMVGIGYEVETFEYDVVQRTYDYTPTQDFSADSSMSFRYQTPIRSGGADTFLLVLEQEIIPFVDSLFKTTENRTIAGHSLGGLFATYVMLEKPRLFTNYLIASPAVWWDENILLLQLKARENMIMPAGKIFLGIGKNETKRMKIAAKSLNKYLRKNVKIKNTYRYEIIPDSDHFFMIPYAITKSQLFIFAPEK
ncbi:MAG: hypothetical protein A2W93_09770 [Bacteroidetes bacterium GWF2_43_63]|nr:MAG: hypothetical protein A2W94_00145 [Bacteroidetes bacterium GWE2_42_42]OFY56142.1 MAG: hypothetical protein A2W93_09770 [Bacteroidetes bacterium GWF2_43_63]HBG69764.1 hypothetical protein [Bacteroidales bacterium]HCB61140.1 hypothetical protein [Bacteroidales bacterium]HCY24064.1 hypothetical protein [Bacteroidales bacterium]